MRHWSRRPFVPEGNVCCDLSADNTFLHIQATTDGTRAHAPFGFQVQPGRLLGPDHTLVIKVAVWLDVTDRLIHIEPTFAMIYEFGRRLPAFQD